VAVQRRMNWARSIFRSAFFVPLLVSGASISIVFSYIFDPVFGVVNYYLHLLGLPQVPWLNSSWGALLTIIIVVTWQQLGFTFIVFSAALGAVPKELIEAARTDGAGGWRIFRKITVPMISPSILFTVTVGVISALQLFDQPYVLTSGGPGYSTETVVLDMYQQAFQNLRFGYASSISVILFIVVLIATYLQFRISRKWVFYS
jgi:multiple sugar transport system permease protein